MSADGAGSEPGDISQLRTPDQWANRLRAQAARLRGERSGVPLAETWQGLTWLARREGFAVEREHRGMGDSVTIWRLHTIRVRPGLGPAEAIAALAHELGHVLLHPPVPGDAWASTAGCRGIQHAEAVSVAFVVSCVYGVDPSACELPAAASWAGTDPRANPQATVHAASARIASAAATITRHLRTALPSPARPAALAASAAQAPVVAAAGQNVRPLRATASSGAEPVPAAASPHLIAVLRDAQRFFQKKLGGSWVPGYLVRRGLNPAAARQWEIGYAPRRGNPLVSHLRGIGHTVPAIEQSGVARRTGDGTLSDLFRDRVMLPVHDENGDVVGFIGRAHPGASSTVPKYLNTPQTAAYRKGELLFGLHQSRGLLAQGATPVIVEGPFDAVAVIVAGGGQFAGVAPCGTALTAEQVTALVRVTGPGRPTIVAFDADTAGRRAAVKAWHLLHARTGTTAAADLPAGRDPAELLQKGGPLVLCTSLQERRRPLADLVIDAHLARWDRVLDSVAGQLNAMRSAARLIADTLPAHIASDIAGLTHGNMLEPYGRDLRPLALPELEIIARTLPPDAARQVSLLAERVAFDLSEVMAEVANAVTKGHTRPRRSANRVSGLAQDEIAAQPDPGHPSRSGHLAAISFPVTASAAVSRTDRSAPYSSQTAPSRRLSEGRPLRLRR